jgi:lipopolysaccharide/colanic/teichoic acid biosynthesis glycosyltransferase
MRRQERTWHNGVDIVTAGCVLFLVLPMVLLITIAIQLTSPGPVLFPKEVLSPDGAHFSYYRFRTTGIGTSRFTALGRLLRGYHLDELPLLWSVLRGDIASGDVLRLWRIQMRFRSVIRRYRRMYVLSGNHMSSS